MRKIFTLFLFITLCTILPAAGQTVWNGTVDTDWYTNGPEADGAYHISTAAELAGLAQLVNEGNTFDGNTIKLTQDITLNENVLTESGELSDDGSNFKQWTAIGTLDESFQGSFDGQNHTISGIYINNNSDYQGLFGYVDGEGATIQNLSVTDSYIKARNYVGGIVGFNYSYSEVSNCSNNGAVTGGDKAYVGGIVGFNYSYSEVSNCSNSGTVTGGDKAYVGGIVGFNYGMVSNCSNSGTVTGGDDAEVGGIVGIVGFNYSYSEVSNCSNSGTVTGGDDAEVGGIVGYNYGMVSNCYYLEKEGLQGVGGGSGTAPSDDEMKKTSVEYASGEVVRLLDSDGDTWGQKLDGNSFPVPLSCLSEAEREACKVYTVTLSYEGKTETIYGNKNGVIEAPAEAIAPEGKIYVWDPELPYTIQGTETSPITITGTLQAEPEEPADPEEPEEPEPETPVIPDMPDYYNIMVEECEGVTVETSTSVVREGQSMTFTIDIAEGYTDENMTVKVKRSLFGYTEVIEPNNEGIYEVKNIYTDIYITVDGVEDEEEETPTGMEDIEGAKVYAKDGSIYVQTPTQEQVQIISISGAVLKNETQIGLQRYDLPRGIYIICIDEQRFKVRN